MKNKNNTLITLYETMNDIKLVSCKFVILHKTVILSFSRKLMETTEL